MRLLVMGAGSLGSVVGGFMAKAGHDVTLVGRQVHMSAIASDGLRISGIWGEHRVHGIHSFTSADAVDTGPFDIVLITVKSYDTRDAIGHVRRHVTSETLVCSYQNGLGNIEAIAEVVGWRQCFGARAIFGSWMPEPGHVEVTVIANPSALGTWHPDTDANRVRVIAETMNATGVPTVYTDRIATVLWSKVAYNCALNPMSALLDVPYGALGEIEATRAVMRDAIHELYAVGHAKNIALEPFTPEDYLTLFYEKLLPTTAQHYASMREDFRRKRRTEIDAINGAIARYGEELGIPCPINATLTRLVKAREFGYLSGFRYSGNARA